MAARELSKTDVVREMYAEMTSDLRKKMIAKIMKKTDSTEAVATTLYTNVRREAAKAIVDASSR